MRTVAIRVDPKLRTVLEKLQVEIASNISKQYHLDDVKIHGTLASRVAAERLLKERNSMDFKIRKIGLSKGVLEFL